MSLRLKTTLILLTSVVALLLILLGTAYFILLPSYVRLEQDYLWQDTNRVAMRLNNELLSLERFVLDWSSWDDTYEFVAHPTAEYISSNLVSSTFVNSRLTAVLLANKEGEVVYRGFYDHGRGQMLSNMPDLEGMLYEPGTDRLRPAFTERSQATFLAAPAQEALFFVASQPVLDSAETQPSRGTMIMVRLLDEAWLENIAAEMQVNVDLLTWDRVGQVLNPAQQASLLADDDMPLITIVRTHNNSYKLFTDFAGQPAAVVILTADRTIFNNGQRTLNTFVLVTIGMGLVVIGLMIYILSTQVITRVVALEQAVLYVREKEDLTYRVPDHGRDEIAALGQQINRLLTALNYAVQNQLITEADLRAERQQLEERVQIRTQELAQANEILRQLDASKSQFINDISHEFRTPVTNLRLYLDLWQRGNETQQARYLAVIELQITRLIKLSESVMRLAEIEFATHECEWHRVDLAAFVDSLLENYQEYAEERGLQLIYTAVFPHPISLCSDLIRTLFEELLDNSLRYSEAGTISLDIRPYQASNGTEWAEIEVRDEGIGITAEDMPHVYDRFYRGRGASQSNRPGIGVGLTIVRHIVTLHHGELFINSVPDEGTAVVVRLPLVFPVPDTDRSLTPTPLALSAQMSN